MKDFAKKENKDNGLNVFALRNFRKGEHTFQSARRVTIILALAFHVFDTILELLFSSFALAL